MANFPFDCLFILLNSHVQTQFVKILITAIFANKYFAFFFLLAFMLHFSSSYAFSQKGTHITFKVGKGKVIFIDTTIAPGNYLLNPKKSYKPKTGSSAQNLASRNTAFISTSVTDATCGSSNGIIVATASGGTAPYTYSLNNGTAYNTGNFPQLAGGTYVLTVTDANGVITSTNVTVANIHSPPQLTVSSVTTPSACDAFDAVVTLNASGGLPPYQYSIDGVNFQTSNIFSNLSYGLYDFFVKDANGCVGRFNGFNLILNFFPANCNGGYGATYSAYVCNYGGDITATAQGILGPYTYSIDGVTYNTTGVFTNLAPGIYPIYFKDATGHIEVYALAIVQICEIVINYSTLSANCGQTDGTLNLSASNGTAPYTYSIDGINYQSSNLFTGLASGNYYVTIRDAAGLTNSQWVVVDDLCPQVTATTIGESCGGNDGTITATATGGTSPYQFSIDGVNFQISNVFSGLATGLYTITLKDANGFTATTTIFVPETCINVNAIVTDATCGNNNGKITASASASNGTAPYQYSIDGVNFQSSNIFNGLAPGTYTVTAKDNSGETGTKSLTVFNIQGPQINTTITPTTCSNNDGSISITGTGGTLPFSFSLNGNPYQANNVFANLTPATYTAFVKDANGCIASQVVTIISNCPVPTLTVSNETCSSRNGSISISVSGGIAPYQYSLDGVNFQTSNVFIGLQAGTYTVTAKDSWNTVNSASATISNICPSVSATVTNGICSTANASITAIGSNGNSPYQYSIDGINFQSSGIFSGLTTGPYTITIKDANGLTNTTNAAVNNFPGPSINTITTPATCLNNNGVILITAASGTPPLRYSVDGINFQSTGQFNQLASGNYSVIVKDANGCAASESVVVGFTDDLLVNAGNNNIPVFCEGGQITIPAASNGTSFTWSPAASLNDSHVLNPVASPAVTTNYILTATLGICSKSDTVTVTVLTAPVADAGTGGTICYGQDFQLNGSGGISYNWSPSNYLNSSQIQNPLVSHPQNTISYNLQVTDYNGCKSLNTAAVTIIVTPPTLVSAGRDTSVVLGQPFQLMASDVNNSGFTQYLWSPSIGLNNSSIQNPITDAQQEITYTVTATTPAGCEGTDAIHIKVYKGPEIYVPSAFTPNNDGKNDLLKAIPVGIKQFNYFTVYSRWGERVFYTTDPGKGWDGKLQGVDQNTSVFVWIAEGLDVQGQIIQRKGTVTLLR